MTPRLSLLIVALACLSGRAHATWRSSLYPSNWTPGTKDAQGRALHDFSYAGYHAGEAPIPTAPPGATIDVTLAPYSADPTGASDATAAIQGAIDAAGIAGGGVVYLPPGTYQLNPPPGRPYCLVLDRSRVVLRGAGPTQTRLYNATREMRDKRVILVRPRRDGDYAWYWEPTEVQPITADLTEPTTSIPVAGIGSFAAGDWIVLQADSTDALIAELGMTGKWTPQNLPGPIFYRRIVAVDPLAKVLTIDTPTRFRLLGRDNARVNRIPPHLEEVGIEGLAIGNRQNDTAGTGDADYASAGTGAYQMHASFAIYLTHVVDGWIRDVASYRPASNSKDVHLLSNGIRLDYSRFVTVERVQLQKPQYRGEGGNGYLFVLTGNDNLVVDAQALLGRHNYSFAFLYSSGNVIYRSSATAGRLPVDFHQKLSPANLIDNLTLDQDHIEAAYRSCCDHGHSSTENVFWNSNGLAYRPSQFLSQFIVDSAQLGHGYVIGTRGAAAQVVTPGGNGTEPIDLSEGIGTGDELRPRSLYDDQRRRRLGLPLEDDPDGGVPEVDGGASSADAGTSIDLGGSDDVVADLGGRIDPQAGCGCSVGAGAAASATLPCALVLSCIVMKRRRPGAARRYGAMRKGWATRSAR